MQPSTAEIYERLDCEGDAYFATALRSIRNAARSVDLEMYIFADDAIGQAFGEALADRARAGLQVRVIYDRVGSLSTPRAFWRRLEQAGVQVYGYHRLRIGAQLAALRPLQFLRRAFLRRNHRKTIVIDGTEAFLGGFNLMQEASRKHYGPARWLDAMLHTNRPVLVQAIGGIFEDSLRRIRRGDPMDAVGTGRLPVRKASREALAYPAAAARRLLALSSRWSRNVPRLPSRKQLLHPLRTRRRRQRRRQSQPRLLHASVARAFKKLLFRGQKRIWLCYPYFVPYGALWRLLLRRARDSEMDLRVYLPLISDHVWMGDLNRLMARRLFQRGVPVYFYHGQSAPADPVRFNHAKIALVDDWVAVGTSNFDRRSVVLNLEAVLLRYRAPFLEETEALFARLQSQSYPVTPEILERYPAGWRSRLLYFFFRRWV